MFERLLDLNNLYEAFRECSRGVSWKASVQRYEYYLLPNICKLRQSLIDGTYQQRPFYEFDIVERGKHRHIRSVHISDRVLQKALCDQILVPELEKFLIHDNGASRVGKGVDFARRRLEKFLHEHYRKHGTEGYVLKIDISKYFDSIPHDKFVDKLAEVITDDKVINLIRYLVSTFPGACGLGLGAQLSQIGGIFYMNDVDIYCKVVRSIKHYIRYMDDIIIIHHDKDFLRDVLSRILKILQELGLKANIKKTFIMPLKHGFTFLKIRYRLTDTGHLVMIPHKSTFLRETRKIKKLSASILFEQFKSWHNNLVRFHCRRRLFYMRKKLAEKFMQSD